MICLRQFIGEESTNSGQMSRASGFLSLTNVHWTSMSLPQSWVVTGWCLRLDELPTAKKMP
jgi:hypothetical protein